MVEFYYTAAFLLALAACLAAFSKVERSAALALNQGMRLFRLFKKKPPCLRCGSSCDRLANSRMHAL
jgi:hypothetical protein